MNCINLLQFSNPLIEKREGYARAVIVVIGQDDTIAMYNHKVIEQNCTMSNQYVPNYLFSWSSASCEKNNKCVTFDFDENYAKIN